ncbi:MAG: hypothetical protein L6V93_14315 [Clostridiales bacterium]|nr:MAG: hypothetical protein L6V93_14315 [Clostridiales bacterium]
MFAKGAVDIAQPDIFHTGGIYESKKVAAMAEAKHITVSFHNPSGPISNAAIFEPCGNGAELYYSRNYAHRRRVQKGHHKRKKVVFEDGYILIPDKPGIGIEVNEEEIAKTPVCSAKSAPLHGKSHVNTQKGDAFFSILRA